MKAVRIKLTQTQANYRREETIDNKMTYPLPPFSTVIGALHMACGYTSYHPMDISVQGKYGSKGQEVYTDYAFLNSTMNDRGVLVKLKNPYMLSTAYDTVAKACSQGADFDKEIKIDVYNRDLLDEYQQLRKEKKQLEEENKTLIKPALKKIKDEMNDLKKTQKQKDKKSDEYQDLAGKISVLKQESDNISENFNQKKNRNIEKYNKFASVTTSLKNYEILYDVELVIHIKSDEQTMQDIMEHARDIKSIGRSEDFVSITNVELVDLLLEVDEDVDSTYSAYLPYRSVQREDVLVSTKDQGVKAKGTVYFLNKNYTIEDEKRIFEKKQVLYTGSYFIDEECELGNSNIFFDGKYIVAFN